MKEKREMKKEKRRLRIACIFFLRNIVAISLFSFLSSLFSLLFFSCSSPTQNIDTVSFTSFRDIPGVTQEEIAAIQELQKQFDYFVYGSPPSTEAFITESGEIGGYITLLCEWLSALFEIRFEPGIFSHNDMYAKLSTGEVSFGSVSAGERRMGIYFMTDAVAMRSLKIMRLENSTPIDRIAASRPPRYVFMEGAAAMETVAAALPPGSYETVTARDHAAVHRILTDGYADAFIGVNTAEAAFDPFGGIITEDFFPLIFTPLTMVTENPSLEPVISVVNKALASGAYNYLTDFYYQGYQHYRKHKFLMQLTDEERDYLRNNPLIPFASQYLSYPISFFNTTDGKWEGIAFDIVNELGFLTGLDFKIIHEPSLTTAACMALMEAGNAYFMPYLIQSNERLDPESPYGRVLWSQTSYMSDNYALLSKQSYPNVMLNDIPFEKVGYPRGTAYAEMFQLWFPDALYAIEYPNTDAAFMALENGEINMVMINRSRLTAMTNYYELSDYKANFVFNVPLNIYFGFSPGQTVLRSIIDKALLLIETDRIVEHWMSRTYDFEARRLREQRPRLIGAVIVSIFGVIVLLLVLVNNHNKRLIISKQAAEVRSLLEKTRQVSDYELMKHTLTIRAMNLALWDMEIPPEAVKSDAPFPADSPFNWSQEFRHLLGFSDEQDFPNIISSWANLLHPEDQERTINAILKHVKDFTGQTPYDIEYRLKTKSGEYRYFHAIGMTQRDSNGFPLRLAGGMEDITEKKQVNEKLAQQSIQLALAERDREADRKYMAEIERARTAAENANIAKSTFLANMSHEIRTPMNSIIGFSELAADDSLPKKTNDYLGKITQSAEMLLSIINDILDISKIESGKMELEHIPFDLHEIFEYCRTVISPKVEYKGISLYCYAEPSTGKKLLGDPVRLRQVLINILSNAVKFTDKGTVKLLASIKNSADDKITVYFEVKDSGIGMNADEIAKIFEPFMQADNSITRKFGGTGLGLTITKSIIEMMGGTLQAESVPGIGSKFSFELTFDTVDYEAEEISAKNKILNIEKPEFEGEILICEDNALNQQVIGEHLNRVGLETVIAENGKIGVDIVKERIAKGEKPFNLIFMDIHMPEMDGLEASKLLIEAGCKTPIITLTANVMSSELERYKEVGMTDALSKPFTSAELWTLLMKYLPLKKVSELQ